MIKIEKTNVFGWEAAIRGMRNPMNSWDKSDSGYKWVNMSPCDDMEMKYVIGENDLKLMKQLANAGSDHGKFMRMINVTCDITAPLYWIAEHDTYKVSTVRNSCSFMHKGVSKPFEIKDFSVCDNRIYEVLTKTKPKKYELLYPYETNEYKLYTTKNGRQYEIYKNGKVFSKAYDLTDISNRTRHFKRVECKPSPTSQGYYELNIGGRSGEKWLLHRLIANVWLNKTDETVNHIDGNKGNNSVENLEWCSRNENITKGFENGLYNNNLLRKSYIAWKNSNLFSPDVKREIKDLKNQGVPKHTLATMYGISEKTLNNLLYIKPCENSDLFELCYTWEKILDTLNKLRDEYLETGDNSIFFAIRQLLPQGYNLKYTWSANYAVLKNIYHARKNHKLEEWHDFCHWVEELPYSELIIGGKENVK